MGTNRRIVLINPPAEVWGEGKGRLAPILNTLPQIGIASLAAVLRQQGIEVSIIDAQALGMTPRQAVAWAVSRDPAAVGLTGYTSSVHAAAAIARDIKAALPGVVTVIGGPHVTAVPEQTMTAFADFDYGLIGEGERSAPVLFQSILAGESPIHVAGAVRREGGTVRVNERPALIDDLDKIPPPAFELLPGFPNAYHPPIFHSPKGRAVTLVTSRGCPFHCTFCDRGVFGNRYRFHGVGYIVEMIRRLKEAHGADHFIFYDDNFTADKHHLAALCEEIIRLPFRITFACDARADLVDKEILTLMKRAGAWMISYGIETANPELLKLLDKSLSLSRAERAVRLTREAGIIVKGLFMIGVPGETVQTIERTKAFIDRLPFDLINVSKFTPYPGSDIHRTISQYGSFQEDWRQMSAMNFVFWPNTVDREVLKREGMAIPAEFYSKPRRIKNIFRRTMNRRDAARIAYLVFLKATGRLRDVFAVDGGRGQ
jgi:anaerobic magnesium-protoporphyrin IX monomethyl ester cyclase